MCALQCFYAMPRGGDGLLFDLDGVDWWQESYLAIQVERAQWTYFTALEVRGC